jgi:hypothetical protein
VVLHQRDNLVNAIGGSYRVGIQYHGVLGRKKDVLIELVAAGDIRLHLLQ